MPSTLLVAWQDEGDGDEKKDDPGAPAGSTKPPKKQRKADAGPQKKAATKSGGEASQAGGDKGSSAGEKGEKASAGGDKTTGMWEEDRRLAVLLCYIKSLWPLVINCGVIFHQICSAPACTWESNTASEHYRPILMPALPNNQEPPQSKQTE